MIRVHIFFNKVQRLDGGPWLLFQAMLKMPEVEAYWYDCRTSVKHLPKADWNICVDWSEDNFGQGDFFHEPHPNIYWASDTHVSPEAFRYRMDKAKRFDKVFCYNHNDVERFAAEGVKAAWLPCAAEPMCYQPYPDIEKKYDIGFVGHFLHAPERMKFLDLMCKAFPSFRIEYGKFFEDAAKELASMRVVLNHIHIDAANMRVYEAMAAGACLLTYATSDLPKVGIDPFVHCLTYSTMDEAIDRVRWALDHPIARQAMGVAAREHILNGHSYVHRAYRMLDIPVPANIRDIVLSMPPGDQERAPMPVRGL